MFLCFEVHDLAADHALDGSRRLRDQAHDLHCLRSRALHTGQHLVSLCLQRIPGKDSDRFAKDNVAGRLAAPQIIVIQGGQIIMNQGIGVQHFDRRAQLFHPLDRLIGTRDHSCRFHAQYRPQPLASGKNTVPHRPVNRDRRLIRTGQEALQSLIDKLRTAAQNLSHSWLHFGNHTRR